ncbi:MULTISPECIES: hypothetical protein [Bacillus]|uniref:hypothetical protein n=1 Tax=Bacillus TaxID=1386 RepID=UPI0005A3644B|nr:hypothetical protein [Bacillus cereus]AJG62191.1 hypothetical protein AW22_5271 [Bacillus cereus D17]QKI12734.1 hypothetical protein FOC91_12300 [Bacillus cereus]
MSCYDEEFYHEPSEFEQQVDELKETLMNAVKDEFKEEMDRLRKENAELQEVKKNMKEIEQDYKRKSFDLDWKKKNLETTVRRERLSELMKDFQVELYTVSSRGKEKPKCDKCNEKRRIPYKTPLGNDTYETCDCSSKIQVYEPMPILLNEFSIRNGESCAWYQVKDGSWDEYLHYYEDSINGKELITSEEQFESIGYSYKTLFKDKEIAQKYCDYKNKKDKE